MSIYEILNSLEKSWGRDDILLKINNGIDTDEIINEFLAKNEMQIKELKTLFKPEDIELLNQIEQLSTCESKLISKIKDLNYLGNNQNHHIIYKKEVFHSNSVPFKRIRSFMLNWSNKVVVIALLTISAIALSKQAWA